MDSQILAKQNKKNRSRLCARKGILLLKGWSWEVNWVEIIHESKRDMPHLGDRDFSYKLMSQGKLVKEKIYKGVLLRQSNNFILFLK